MTRRNYPLNALRVFEVAARRLSFVKAADELHVTPAAVSHQVKRLEEFLDVALFRRLPRGLVLTDTGQILVVEMHEVFLQLDKAMERVQASGSLGALTISVAPVFAVKWLVPRLQRFSSQHPDIDVRMSSSLNVVDFQRDGFDAAVRIGHGEYPGLESVHLFDESITPICSPRLLDSSHPLTSPEQLVHHTLLHDDSSAANPAAPNWTSWLQAAGITGLDASRGPRFGQPDHAMQAAIDGTGVALGWQYLVADDIAANRLVMPFNLTLPLGWGFYLVYPEAHTGRRKIAIFRDWLVEQTSEIGGTRK